MGPEHCSSGPVVCGRVDSVVDAVEDEVVLPVRAELSHDHDRSPFLVVVQYTTRGGRLKLLSLEINSISTKTIERGLQTTQRLHAILKRHSSNPFEAGFQATSNPLTSHFITLEKYVNKSYTNPYEKVRPYGTCRTLL